MSGHASDSDRCEDLPKKRVRAIYASSDPDSDERFCPSQPRKKIQWAVRTHRPQRRAQTQRRRAGTVRPRGTDTGRQVGRSNDAIYSVPLEIWAQIFKYVLRTEPAVPFLYRVSSVLPLWQYLPQALVLQKVDLSASHIQETHKWLSSDKISQCREISLQGLSDQVIHHAAKALRDHCPDLEVVHLSHCDLQEDCLTILADGCQKIGQLDISFSQQSRKTLTLFFQKAGSCLKELKMAGILVLPTISYLASCPQLEVLDLSGSMVQGLNVERLQQHCPALRVLHLSDAMVSREGTAHPQGAGFLYLEELSCANSGRWDPICNNLLTILLHNVTGLTLLDLQGCTRFNPWVSIYPGGRPSPITSLKRLLLGRSSIGKYCEWLTAALQQWSHSLTELDLSGIVFPAGKLEKAFSNLRPVPLCPLAHINLSSSSVSPSCVLTILDTFRDLVSLDLTSCRSMPRALRRLHMGPSGLTLLRARLQPGCPDSDTEEYYEPDDNTGSQRKKRKRRKPSRYES